MSVIKVTPEIETDTKVVYLITIDGDHLAFVDTISDAKAAVDSIAAEEWKRFQSKGVKVFREEFNDGQKIVISTQSLGYIVDGSVIPAMTVSYSSVSRIRVLKARLEKIVEDECESDEESDKEE